MPCFGNLTKIIFGENYRVFLLDGVHHCISHVEQIRPQRQVLAMLFQYPKRKNASSLCLCDG